jgi:hypothetical protein
MKNRKTSRVLFEGWAPCLRPRFAVELGLAGKEYPTRLPVLSGQLYIKKRNYKNSIQEAARHKNIRVK